MNAQSMGFRGRRNARADCSGSGQDIVIPARRPGAGAPTRIPGDRDERIRSAGREQHGPTPVETRGGTTR
ncbi:hypothetical protein FRAAL4282 [Frankia alni ACN14a]|uniref:Uncharacterized protein n=1 Tax=Frankia alni (strain DSM 45986 / CECT 9034 / ACN14a) TaxID=326424 RepID=Q0RHU9_FRAAA|nr:hypothetical protein FRAAL4282 [Frankia alni ACN14a]